MENLRSQRAIQRDDVWAAADALLLEGKRPTIERVRQKIGRGSPNTVSPMLEEWFATLGPRMAQLKGSGTGPVAEEGRGTSAPAPVLQAAQALWDAAMHQAVDAAQAQLAQEREQLQAARQALHAEQNALAQEQAAMAQQRASLEQSLAVAHAQIKMQGARLAELEQGARQKDQFAAQQQQRLQALEQELFASRKARDEADRAHAEHLREQHAAAQAQQHRALQDIDRARQEAKQWMAAHRAEQEKLAKLEVDWHAERKALQLQAAEVEAQWSQSQTRAQQLQQDLQATMSQHAHQIALMDQQFHAQKSQLQRDIERLQADAASKLAVPKQVPDEAPYNPALSTGVRKPTSLAQSARSVRTVRKLARGGSRNLGG